MNYPNQPPAPPAAGNPTLILVLGILGLVMCPVCAIAAWIMGNTYVSNCRSMGIAPEGPGTAGRVLGIVGTILLVVGFVVWFLIAVLAVGAASMR